MNNKLHRLENQVQTWNKLAIIVPTISTIVLGIAYISGKCPVDQLFFIACGLYFFTAVIWWWWTMKSIQLLASTLVKAKDEIFEVAVELKNIRKEIILDRNNDT